MEKRESALIVLTPAESKRLIARAVASHPLVREAMRNGRVLVTNGTTNAYVGEELLGRSISKYHYAAGYIAGGALRTTSSSERLAPLAFWQGKLVDTPMKDFLKDFGAEDVLIKGASAVDPLGHVGVLVANDQGGTIGMALGIVAARGCHLIVPVGLEKLIPSVERAAAQCGTLRFKHATGLACGLVPVVNAMVITEIQALVMLGDVEATHVASGGIADCLGAVTLAVTGSSEAVDQTFALVQGLKGEPPVGLP